MDQLKFKSKICLTVIDICSVFLTVFLNQMITTVFPAYPSVQTSLPNDSVIPQVGIANCTIPNPSNVFVAILIGSKYSTELVMFPIVGWIADKYFPPLILFCGVLVETAACVVYASSGDFYVTILARVMDAVGYSIVSTSAYTIIYTIYLHEQSRNKVITIDSILDYIAISISPFVAGSIFEHTEKFGHDASRVYTFMIVCPFFLCITIFLVPFAFRKSWFSRLLGVYKQEIYENQANSNIKICESENLYTKLEGKLEDLPNSLNIDENLLENTLKESSSFDEKDKKGLEGRIEKSLSIFTLLRDPHIIIVLLCLILDSLICNFLETTLPIFMIRKFCSDQREQGTVWLFGILSLLGFFLSSIIFHKNPKICWILPMVGLMIIGVLCTFLSYGNPWWVIGICLGTMFFFSSMTQVLLIPLVPKIIDVKYSKVYGSGSGLTLMTFTISGLIGTFPVGPLVEKLGFFTLCSLLCIFNFIAAPLVICLKQFFE